MTCSACIAFDAAERAAIQDDPEIPDHTLDGCACVTDEITVTHFSHGEFKGSRQAGRQITQERIGVLQWLTTPSFHPDDKKAFGAWCPCSLPDGIVKDGKGDVCALVTDVNNEVPGGGPTLEEIAERLAACAGVVIPTFNATLEQQKCRIVFWLTRPLTSDEFSTAWRKMARILMGLGIVADNTCSNINRLYFACVARSPEAWLGARLLDGSPIDVNAMLAQARKEEDDLRRVREIERARRRAMAPTGGSKDGYIAAAIAAEQQNVATATAGGRHHALLRAVFALARPELGLTESQVEDALLEDFVLVAGDHRRREGERVIRDAYAARVKAPN